MQYLYRYTRFFLDIHIYISCFRILGLQIYFENCDGIYLNSKKCVYEGVILQTALHGAEAWGMRNAGRRGANVFEMKCLRSFVRVSRMDGVRNEVVSRTAGIEIE